MKWILIVIIFSPDGTSRRETPDLTLEQCQAEARALTNTTSRLNEYVFQSASVVAVCRQQQEQ
jgi:hypothetical protein